MRTWLTFLLSISAVTVHAQVIQSGGATTPVSWRPAAVTDSLRIDVDGDAAPDLVFKTTATTPSGSGQPSFFWFTVYVARGSRAEMAIDANEFDSVHRFASGDAIGPGLLWQNGGYLAYTVTGNGGTGGRGFFRSNDGFIAIRKQVGNQMRYWWFYLGTRAAGTDWVGYYAGTAVALANHLATGTPPVLAYPNPAVTAVALSRPVAYELFDSRGALVSTSLDKPVTKIALEALPAGLYLLQTHSASGSVFRQKLVKQ